MFCLPLVKTLYWENDENIYNFDKKLHENTLRPNKLKYIGKMCRKTLHVSKNMPLKSVTHFWGTSEFEGATKT